MPDIQYIRCFRNEDGAIEFQAVLFTLFARQPAENDFLYRAVMAEEKAFVSFGISPDPDCDGWAYRIEGVLSPAATSEGQARALARLAFTLSDLPMVMHQYVPDLSALATPRPIGRPRKQRSSISLRR
jgi:hypothetical protein